MRGITVFPGLLEMNGMSARPAKSGSLGMPGMP